MFKNQFTKENILKIFHTTKGRIILIALAASFAFPIFVSDTYIIRIVTLIAIFTIYASSWNLLASSGQGSLGHAAFLGIGGFSSSLLAINLGIPPIIGIFIGAVFSAGSRLSDRCHMRKTPSMVPSYGNLRIFCYCRNFV